MIAFLYIILLPFTPFAILLLVSELFVFAFAVLTVLQPYILLFSIFFFFNSSLFFPLVGGRLVILLLAFLSGLTV